LGAMRKRLSFTRPSARQRISGRFETRILLPCITALKNKCYFIPGAYKWQTMQLKYDTIYNYSIIPTFSREL
jgi:hypothetical protein